jgi:hypothetical protein
MIWLIITIALLICTIIGFVMVNKTGNYENKWGYMLFWGGAAFCVSLLGKFLFVLFI